MIPRPYHGYLLALGLLLLALLVLWSQLPVGAAMAQSRPPADYCCLTWAMAQLLELSPDQLEMECRAIHCQQQPNADCMSAYGALQVAQYLGIPAHSPSRWDWAAIDAHIWDGVVVFAYPWAGPGWTPDGLAHAFYCQGDKWLPLPGYPAGGLRLAWCQDTMNPEGTWWDVRTLQHTWTGWAVVR